MSLCLFYLVIYYLHCYLFTFSYCVALLIRNLVLDNHLVELGAQDNLFCFSDCLTRTRRINFQHLVPREFDINPRVTLVGKTTLATALCTWSPNEEHRLLPSRQVFWRRCRGTRGRTPQVEHLHQARSTLPLHGNCHKIFGAVAFIFINLCNNPSLGRLHHCELFLLLLDF